MELDLQSLQLKKENCFCLIFIFLIKIKIEKSSFSTFNNIFNKIEIKIEKIDVALTWI